MPDTYKENPVVRYWQIIVVMIALSGSWAVDQFRLDALADDLKEVEENVEKIDEAEEEIEKKIIAIEADVKSTKEDVKEIKTDVREILRKLDRDDE